MDEPQMTDGHAGKLGRVLVKAVSVGAVGALIALGASGPNAAVGAFAGSVIAGLYGAGYLRSHTGRRDIRHTYDRRVARSALLRLGLIVAGGGAVMAGAGRPGLQGYVLGFAAGFPFLVMTEAPRAFRQLKARGFLGDDAVN